AVALPEALAHVDEAGADAMRRWIGADPEARFADALARRVRILITGEGAADGYRGWNQTLADDVAAALQASRDEGEDLGQLSHRLRETLGDDATRARAMTIARTEANGIANDLAHEAFAASGVVKRKRWYS